MSLFHQFNLKSLIILILNIICYLKQIFLSFKSCEIRGKKFFFLNLVHVKIQLSDHDFYDFNKTL